MLYDDPRVSGKRDAEEADYHQAAELYRQLRVNFEESRQHIEAGDFYVGQMDMRRHDTHFGRLYRGLLSLYRFAALYGESYWRPLALYALLAELLFAPLYLLGGFRGAAVDVYGAAANVHRPAWAGIGALGDGALWGDYAQAAYLALTAGVPFRAELHVVSPWVVVPYFGNALLNILLLALAVIALRRQFKR